MSVLFNQCFVCAAMQPPTPDVVSRYLPLVSEDMSGSWLLDKSASDSLAPFVKHLGAPWALQQLADTAVPTRTFTFSAVGVADTQVTTGLMGRTQRQEWFWREAPMPLPIGGSFPSFATFSPDGRLAYRIAHPKGPIITVFDAVKRDGTRATLTLQTMCFDKDQRKLLTMRRVFTRPL